MSIFSVEKNIYFLISKIYNQINKLQEVYIMNIPRNEYPRPQLVRKNWLNLNGEWDFEIDNSKVGEAKEFFKRDSLDTKITVPFCPESELSGVNHKDFINCVWYRKNIEIPSDWNDKNVILHFGAVDYHTIVYVNGENAG